jgi:flagellar basal-body rod modification protein FlgD
VDEGRKNFLPGGIFFLVVRRVGADVVEARCRAGSMNQYPHFGGRDFILSDSRGGPFAGTGVAIVHSLDCRVRHHAADERVPDCHNKECRPMSTVSTSTTASASDIQLNYMTLLVTQLRNQNPLEPMDNQEMASQLAQFNQLQQLETLNTSFSGVLDLVQRSYASSLVGKEVSFDATLANGTTETVTGKVTEVTAGNGGDIVLTVGDRAVSLSGVTSIRG